LHAILAGRIAAVVVDQVIAAGHASKDAVLVRDEALGLIVLVKVTAEVVEGSVLEHEDDQVVEQIVVVALFQERGRHLLLS